MQGLSVMPAWLVLAHNTHLSVAFILTAASMRALQMVACTCDLRALARVSVSHWWGQGNTECCFGPLTAAQKDLAP